MSDNETDQTIQRFCNYFKQGEVCIIAGAGISYNHPSHLPLAGQIREEILRQLWKNGDVIQRIDLLDNSSVLSEDNFVDIFTKNQQSELRFELLMQATLDSTKDLLLLRLFQTKRFNQVHRFIAEALSKGNQVLTTNFDVLIEKALEKRNKVRVISVDSDFWHVKNQIGKRKFLFKIHGTLEREDSIKATLRQVGQSGLAFMWERGKGEVLGRLLKKYHLLVLGYSGTDDFDMMSKLVITKSDKEVLWVKHVNNALPQLLSNDNVSKEFKDNILKEFLGMRHASVVLADSNFVVAKMASMNFDAKLGSYVSKCKCANLNRPFKTISNTVKKWGKANKGSIDFLAGRLLYLINKPAASLKVFQKLEKLFLEVRDKHNYARTLLNIAVIKEELGEINEAIKYQEAANNLFLEQGDVVTTIDSLVNLGVLKMRIKNFSDAERILRKAVTLSKEKGLEGQNAKALSNLASYLWTIGKYDEAMKHTRNAAREYKKTGNLSGCAVCYATMGKIVYSQKGDTEFAKMLFSMAMEFAVRLRDLNMQSTLWNNLGGIYRKQGKLKSAINAYDQALFLSNQIGNKQSIAVSKMGKVIVELSRGNLDKAIEMGIESINEGREVGLLDHTAQTAGNIGLAFLDKKQYAKAVEYLNMAKEDFEKLNLPVETAFTYRNIGECLLRMSQEEAAGQMIRKSHDLYIKLGQKNNADEAIKLLKTNL